MVISPTFLPHAPHSRPSGVLGTETPVTNALDVDAAELDIKVEDCALEEMGAGVTGEGVLAAAVLGGRAGAAVSAAVVGAAMFSLSSGPAEEVGADPSPVDVMGAAGKGVGSAGSLEVGSAGS
jgi:hypothetical protein